MKIPTIVAGTLPFLFGLSLFTGMAPAGLTVQEPGAGIIVDRVAAVVNGEVVTLSDLRWLLYYRGLTEPQDPDQRKSFFENLLQQLIEQKLIAAEAAQTPGIQISREQVDDRVKAYGDRFGSEEKFQDYLKETDISLADLQELIRRQLAVVSFVKVRFEPFIIILPDQIQEYYDTVLVPELQASEQEAPPLRLVEEQIRDILTVARVNQEMDNWVRNALRKAAVDILLFDGGEVTSNLPEAYRLDSARQPVQIKRPPEPPPS